MGRDHPHTFRHNGYVDGFVARHFHMTSELGKMLDPVADKLTRRRCSSACSPDSRS